ncbi:DUF6186 family protein [Cumulibacter manganitolerans]|uniref:DUF6186 family protein n=1 Tax=Cumulibacter manganitolerans TaxID=1884992 RepID=UPI001294CB2E|nr:DUF6186 family protein [Cumulibacter manganitolerans]
MSSHVWTVAGYLAVVLLLAAIEVAGRRGRGRWITLAEAMRRATRHRAAQIGLVLAWWWVGWHFFGG